MTDTRKIRARALAAVYSALYLIVFLIFYLPNYAFELPEESIGGFLIFRDICERLVQFFVPLSAAAVLFVRSANRGIRGILLPSLLLSAPSLVYALPYCYLYALSQGYDSAEGTVISLLLSAFGAILLALWIILLVTVSRTVAGVTVGRGIEGASLSERRRAVHLSLADSLEPSGMFDLSSVRARGIFAAGLTVFSVQVILEIVSVILFFTEDGAYYDGGDILYISLTFVFMLTELLGCYALSYFISKKIAN